MEPKLSAMHAWLQRCIAQLDTGVRTCTTFIVEQHHLHPHARGVVWDLRARGDDGLYGPLDFDAVGRSYLDATWWQRMLRHYPHQAVVSHLVDGTQLRADVPLTAVFNPHLLSVFDATEQIDREHHRFVDLGWYDSFNHLPFFPLWLVAQGSVARPADPGRPRPIADAGQPRKDVRHADGTPVVSINAASGAGWRERDACVTAGIEPKWWKEVKPTVFDSNFDDAILLDAANHFWHEPFFAIQDNEADSFMQFALAPSGLWQACVAWR
ncbi:hypothetical protein M885DRAFT_49807 [Pelagophyceae sp. CCMP2097]|nr:hypothetical protein M885DRAFT_49807 [Pelagophyceae sp. CCMP2097]